MISGFATSSGTKNFLDKHVDIKFSYKNFQRINELEDKQEKARKDINALYMKPLTKPKRKTPTKKTTTKKAATKRNKE